MSDLPFQSFAAHAEDLARLSAAARRRTLAPVAGRDFASNDYLGLAGSTRLAEAVVAALTRGVGVGAGGSRLLRGRHEEHFALETAAADFFGTEAALYLGSGFAANAALLATLPQRGDLIVHDALVHASAYEGMRLTRAERIVSAGHNDAMRVDEVIADWRRTGGVGQAWIVAESLYSMDGDRAPLADLIAIADRRGAVLLIDEAHATGVFGPAGRGLAAGWQGRPNVVTLHTCGKAIGTEGALVCGPAIVRDFLVNRARSFIFSTAPSPLIAAATRESLHILINEPERRDQLWANVAAADRAFALLGIAATGSQIVPVVLGDDVRAMAVAAELQAKSFDVRGIRPPTVPPGSARLRISLTANVDEGDVAALGEALQEVLA